MADLKFQRPGARRTLRCATRHSLTVLLATAALGVVSAHAIDGTWTGNTSGEWTDGTNWTSTPSVPDGTATFTNTGPTAVQSNGLVSIGSIQFTAAPNAQAYTIDTNDIFLVNGTGLFNNSTNTQTFNVNSSMVFLNASTASGGSKAVTYVNGTAISFNNASTAGTAIITNNGDVEFNNSSAAGTAAITNNAVVNFQDTTSAGSANITNAASGTLSFNTGSTAGTATIGNSGTLAFANSSNAGGANIFNIGAGVISFDDTSTAGNSSISNFATVNFNASASAGSATINNFGTMAFLNSTTAGNATISNAFTLSFSDSSTAGNAIIENFNTLQFTAGSTAGSAVINNSSSLEFLNTSTAGNATILNDSSLQFSGTSTAGSAVITNNGSLLFSGSGAAGNATITTSSLGSILFLGTSTGGNAQFITNAGGTFNISGLTSTGMTAGSIEGAGSYILGARNLSVGSNNLSTTVSGVISGVGGSLTKVGAGTLTLSNTDTYTGATTVNAGALVVDGSIATSALTTVNAGGTLAGSGTVGNTAIAGGTLAPGSTGGVFGPLTVQGSLSFTAASAYMIQVSPANAGRTNVTGLATLGGATVNAVFQAGSYVDRQYTILNATGGVSGTFNPAVVSNMSNIRSTLTYDANNVVLNIKLQFTPAPGATLTTNQQNVANALTNFFNTTGSIPAAFAGLNAGGLTIASGELGTGVIQSSINADNQFLNVLLDPTIAGRGAGFAASGGASRYAAEDEASSYAEKRLATPSERAAYAMATKAPLFSAQPTSRWSVWGAGYGGSATVSGNAVVGSQDTTARVWGIVGGADYKLTPDTLLGFAVAGGATGFSLANGLGSGSADLFQAGVFGRHNAGPAYLSAALAYGWHDVTTNRTVTLAGFDQLQGRFKAETFSARFEGGYRFVTPMVGITPYAAAQVISFNLPAYAETAVVGTPLFALNYAAQTTTATRTELGLRSDKSIAMQDAVLTLRGRAAWAHDYNPDRAVTAIFQALPGASFVVNGARSDPDAALVSAGAEMKWLNGFSLAATFEGEFSGNTNSYAGKGVAKYSW